MTVHCSGERLGRTCAGEPSIRCGACGAVRYCSPYHQRLHWPEHKHDCQRYEEQMRMGAVLHDFPFTFTHESTFLIDNGTLSTCSFLQSRGVHMLGVWRAECECRESLPLMSGLGTCTWETIGWNLPSNLCPCTGANSAVCRLENWADYYMWRELPLDSPVAILLHWPLTLYHSLQLVAARSPSNGVLTRGTLRIHYLGPDRELDQLEVFAELGGLLQVEHIHLDFIGPSVPGLRDSKQLELKGFLECSDGDCKCKSPSEKEKSKGYVSSRLWKGLYHEVYEQVTEDFPPDFIFAPNAGIAAFPSWVPTVELIDKLKIPAVFTDFCEEATILASNCVKEALACEITIPVQVNPFRQPITPPNKVLELPTYSNCFLFGIN